MMMEMIMSFEDEMPLAPRISSFKELLAEICWSYEYPRYDLEKDGDQGFWCNKLYIARDRVSYKTDTWILAPGVFEQVEKFYYFLKSTEPYDHTKKGG